MTKNLGPQFIPIEHFIKSIRAIYLVQSVVYFILNIRMFNIHKKKFNDLFSNTLTKDIILLRLILYHILAITIVYNIGVNVIGLDNIWSKDVAVIVVLILIIFVTVALGILGSRQNSIYDMDEVFSENANRNRQNLPELKIKILELFENKDLYLNKELTIWDLCRTVNSNRTYVSNLINQEFQLNFNAFVNKYRVEKAKELLRDKSLGNESLEIIAQKSGFNSLASFNRAFQRFENCSPGGFRNLTISVL